MQPVDAGALEVTELESWLDAECPCEVPHQDSTCTGVVYGVLRDVRDVQAEALEQAANNVIDLPMYPSGVQGWLGARAQAIREARSD